MKDRLRAMLRTIRRAIARLIEPRIFFPLILTLLLTVIWGATFNMARVEYAAAERAALAATKEVVEAYQAQVARTLREIDQTLRVVKYAYEGKGAVFALDELRGKSLLPVERLFTVSVVDAHGQVTASTGTGDGPGIANRGDFQALQRADTLTLGAPRRNESGEWMLDFGRRLNASDGTFAGVVLVSVAATHFVSGYEAARLGEFGALGVIGTDGVFRARRTGEAMFAGERVPFAEVTGSAHGEAQVKVVANAWDGIRRYSAVRRLVDFPLVVVAGLSEEEQFAAVNRRVDRYLAWAVAGSALLAFIVILLGRASVRVERSRLEANRALQAEVQYRKATEGALRLRNLAVESSVNAIVIIDYANAAYPIEYVNPAFERMTGYTSAETVGRNPDFLLGRDADQAGAEEIRMALRNQREARAVLRGYRKDGTLLWSDYRIAPVRNDGGEVTHFVGVMNDITEAKHYEEQLAHQANFDTLTGLPNRNLLHDRLNQVVTAAQRAGDSVAVLHLDIDNFQQIRYSFGHNVGDDLICMLADRLRACLRDTDTVARLGTDEFVVLLGSKGRGEPLPGLLRKEVEPSSLDSYVTVLLHKILTNLSLPLQLDGHDIRPSCSIGVSVFPQDGADAATLLKNADAAMSRAKELGHNRFQFFTAEVNDRITRHMELESSLRRAIEREEFELHYQPQVDLHTGVIMGVEALLRWRHPEKGLVYPDQFIEFAEETGLILPIGAWVLTQACIQNKAWQDDGMPPLTVSVNMSARQCEQQDVDVVVKRALKASGLAPQYLELEITESISMEHPELSVPLMQRLKDTGVVLCIDDFGTGFSNMSYLKRFPIDRLKIDLSFVREITTDPGSLAIAEAIITMSHSLGLEVVAEGVETEAQFALLRARDCDLVQGFYFSPAVSAARFAALLADGAALIPAPAIQASDAPALLLVDDDHDVIEVVQRVLAPQGYRLLLATDAAEAFAGLASHEVGVVMANQRLRDMNGVDFLSKVRAMYPATVRILRNRQRDFGATREAINHAAVHKFVDGTLEAGEMMALVDEALKIYGRGTGKRAARNAERARRFRPSVVSH